MQYLIKRHGDTCCDSVILLGTLQGLYLNYLTKKHWQSEELLTEVNGGKQKKAKLSSRTKALWVIYTMGCKRSIGTMACKRKLQKRSIKEARPWQSSKMNDENVETEKI